MFTIKKLIFKYISKNLYFFRIQIKLRSCVKTFLRSTQETSIRSHQSIMETLYPPCIYQVYIYMFYIMLKVLMNWSETCFLRTFWLFFFSTKGYTFEEGKKCLAKKQVSSQFLSKKTF